MRTRNVLGPGSAARHNKGITIPVTLLITASRHGSPHHTKEANQSHVPFRNHSSPRLARAGHRRVQLARRRARHAKPMAGSIQAGALVLELHARARRPRFSRSQVHRKRQRRTGRRRRGAGRMWGWRGGGGGGGTSCRQGGQEGRGPASFVAALAGVTVAIVAAATVVYIRGGHPSAAASGSPPAASATGTVEKRTLTSRVQVNGTLGYVGSYQVINGAQGHWTSLPSIGQVISQGQTISSVDASPVVLFYGTTPAYRDFRLGMSDGEDVKELEQNLLALGYGNSSNLVASGHFDSFDVAAIKRWQKAMGLAQTGVISLGQVVFLPGAIRVTAVSPTLGSMSPPRAPLRTG